MVENSWKGVIGARAIQWLTQTGVDKYFSPRGLLERSF
jgi:hypothetical protein